MTPQPAGTAPDRNAGYARFLLAICSARPFTCLAVILLGIAGTLFGILSPLIMRSLIDNVLIGNNTALLVPLILAMAGVFLVSAAAAYLSARIRGMLYIDLYREFSLRIFLHLQRAEYAALQEFRTGDLQSRITGNTTTVVQTAIRTVPQILVTGIGIVVPLCIMISMDATLAAAVVLPAVLFAGSSAWFGRRMKAAQRPALDAEAGIQSFLKETLPLAPLVRAYGLADWAGRNYDREFLKFRSSSSEVISLSSLNAAVVMLIYSVPTLVILALGSLFVLEGTITIGTLTAFIAYATLFLSPVLQVSDLWTSIKTSQASYERVAGILDLPVAAEGTGSLPPGGDGTVRFENVTFAYGDRVILDGFSAQFFRGINYLVGENGSGKSTLLKLLCRLYAPGSGRITIDGTDIASVREGDLRSRVGIVFADSLVFDGSVADNIRIGNLSATNEDVIRAARQAGLEELVTGLPLQYDTPVGESGLRFSSGELQKIALARVLLRDPAIIVFDEFARSIDEESRRSVYAAIRQLAGRTVIIVTHNSADIDAGSHVVHLAKVQ